MRVLLFTGKGGVGKTTTAAATAVRAARSGVRTLVLSTDAAHSLGDALGADLSGGHPVEVEPRLSAQQVDARLRLEDSWRQVQEYLLHLLDTLGVDAVAAEELTVLPGAEEVLALLELRDQVRSGPWDLVVVDCAPTAETLRLLALPEALSHYLDRLLPADKRLVRSLRPVIGRAAGVPLPADDVVSAMLRLHEELAGVHDVLTAPTTSVRLVLTPEAVVVAEARRTLTSLALYGYRVDGVVANRVFPAGGADAWRQQWVDAQAERLADVEASFAPAPVLRAPYQVREPVGPDALAAFADDVYGGTPAEGLLSPPEGSAALAVEPDGAGWSLVLHLPLARAGEIDLGRRGDDLVVAVGGHRRVIALPAALRRCRVAGAKVSGGRLRVRFEAPVAVAT